MESASRDELESLSDRSMPGTARRRMGDWVLRSDRGATGRANTVWPVGAPAGSIVDAVDKVEAWYDLQHRRAGFQMFAGVSAELIAELDQRDYRTSPGAILMTAAFDELTIDANHNASDTRRIVAGSGPSPEFFDLVGNDARTSEMTSTTLPQRFLTVHDSTGLVLGGGRATLDGRWMGIFAMRTAVEARRAGVAQRVLDDLVAHGRRRGATRLWLQVMHENEPARALYTKIGMSAAHEYDYRFARS